MKSVYESYCEKHRLLEHLLEPNCDSFKDLMEGQELMHCIDKDRARCMDSIKEIAHEDVRVKVTLHERVELFPGLKLEIYEGVKSKKGCAFHKG